MHKVIIKGMLGVLWFSILLRAEYPTLPNRMILSDNDTVIFLGDSITHQCLYTQYLEDYFYTRFPKIRIRFYNAGVGGDKAGDALVRFDEDVAQFKPKYVTVLLGMNDGRYIAFDQKTFDQYVNDMSKLILKIKDIGAQPILLTPTMFDTRAYRMRVKGGFQDRMERSKFYNGVLAYYGAWLREQAFEQGLGFVDMYSPLNELTVRQREHESDFTLITDAIHPDEEGQLVMACAFLQAMKMSSQTVSSIHVLQVGGIWQVQAEGGTASDLQTTESISFTFLADALPWVVPEDAQHGYAMIDAGNRFSNEMLRVSGMAPGEYILKIDGIVVGTYQHLDFACGIPLQNNNKTPQYQQALEVAHLNQERNEKAIRPLRNLWRDLKIKRYQGIADSEPETYAAWLNTFKIKVGATQELIKDYDNKIYKINLPRPQKYELVKQ